MKIFLTGGTGFIGKIYFASEEGFIFLLYQEKTKEN